MEQSRRARTTSEPAEHNNDSEEITTNVSSNDVAEEHSKIQKMLMGMIGDVEKFKVDESDSASAASDQEALPDHQLYPIGQAESLADIIFGRDLARKIMSVMARDNSEVLTKTDLSDCAVPNVHNDPATPMEEMLPVTLHGFAKALNSTDMDDSGISEGIWEKAEIMARWCIEVVFFNEIPVNIAAVSALVVEPGSYRGKGYTVSWKSSDILCFVEYAYQYENIKIPKMWLVKASPILRNNPLGVARLSDLLYVKEQIEEEQAILRRDVESAKANLGGDIDATADAQIHYWLEIGCIAARHNALIRMTNQFITKLRAAAFTRSDLTLQKLSELASDINKAKLDLKTLVEYISSLPPIMESQSSASAPVQSSGRDSQLPSGAVNLTTKRRNERKLKRQQAKHHAAEVINTSTTSPMSNSSVLPNDTLPVSINQEAPVSLSVLPNDTLPVSINQEAPVSLGIVLDDHTNTAEHTSASIKKKNKKKKKGKLGNSQIMPVDHKEAVETSNPAPEDQNEVVETGDSNHMLNDHLNSAENLNSRQIPEDQLETVETLDRHHMPEGHSKTVQAVESHQMPEDQLGTVHTRNRHHMCVDHSKTVQLVESHQITQYHLSTIEQGDEHHKPEHHLNTIDRADCHDIPEDHEEAAISEHHEEDLETTDSHQQCPVFPLAEPSSTAMRNSPRTYVYRTVQRPVDHRKIKSGTELELQKLQLPSEYLAEAKERLSSEPAPMSLEEVRNHNREIERHNRKLKEENSIKSREIISIIRERSRLREAEILNRLDVQTTSPIEHTDTATQKAILIGSDQQVSELGIPSTSSTDLLSSPAITRHHSITQIIAPSLLPTIHESRHENTLPFPAEDLALRTRLIHRRCHSEALHSQISEVESDESVPLGGQNHNEDLSDDEAEDSTQSSGNEASNTRLPRREQHPYTPWTTILEWKYYSTDRERRAIPAGTRAYRFPVPVKVSAEDFRAGDMSGCPVFLFSDFTDNPEPIVEYNEEMDRYEITPHSRPWRGDLRSDTAHPDYLPRGKLCQYQAYEFAGFAVWRHDRDPFSCKLSSCGQMTRDHDVTTIICHGCGTKSRVRYCSKAHLIEDIPNHWKICGTPEEVYSHPCDPGSQPERFYRRYPAIVDVDEDPVIATEFKIRSFQRHRQQTFAIFNKGQYTLFSGGTSPQVVEWPEEMVKKYKPRVERLLNMAFFRQASSGVVDYLYHLLRYCLRLQHKWTDTTAQILRIQLRLEFQYDTRLASPEDPCECVWSGPPALVRECTPTCRAESFEKVGLLFNPGLKAHFERWEAKHWPLRIWQRQHPTVRGWEYRLRGEGFPGVREYQKVGSGFVPVLGKGWEGYGAEYGDPIGRWRPED